VTAAPPIKVLRAITRLNIGGPSRHVVLLTQALNDGVQFKTTLVSGLTAPNEGDMVYLAEEKGIQPMFLSEMGREISLLDDLKALLRMIQVIRAEKPDIVHTHMAKAGTVARLAAILCRVPVVIHTYHGHVFHSYFGSLKTKVFLAIEKVLGMGTSRIITVGDGQRDEIVSFGVAPFQKFMPIRLGLELEPFLEAESVRGSLRKELGVGDDVPLIGISARFVPIKAHEDFLQAAAFALKKLPNALFLMIGDGERRAELEQVAADLGITSSVKFLGFRRDVREVYADLDVVALSSLNEGSPVVLIEASAAGRPVVSTRVGGVPEVVLDGETGLVTPPRDPQALADAMVKLVQDKPLAARLGAAGRQHVYPRYAWSRLVEDIRQLYLRELAATGRPMPQLAGSSVQPATPGAPTS
jgi:glycosyltransferase involved in cell wall biosynthesis